LQALVSEPEKSVKNSIVQFIGTIERREFPNQSWPEVMDFMQLLITSDSMSKMEVRNMPS
jgi:hypothetical protein